MRKQERHRCADRARGAAWIAAAVACVALACFPGRAQTDASRPALAPDFALKALDGRNHRLSEYRGEVVALVFWASWCGGCRRELERLERLQGTYGDAGLKVLGVTLDEEPDAARSVVAGIGVGFPQLHDAGKSVSRAYRPASLPATLLIGRGGGIRYRYGELDSRAERAMLGQLRRLLDE